VTTPAYEFFEHTADIGVRIHGATLPELFTNAARALYAGMGEFQTTTDRRLKLVELEEESVEDLLHDWLEELLFEFTAHGMLGDRFEFARLDTGRLVATVHGAPVDFARSRARAEIKAVTYHQLRVEHLGPDRWRATVIFDV
jgi:SHS2 domain-containing protein